jgi:hypothetical protein
MDGSRLLEVLPFYGRSLDEISSLFDSVAISFTEGLAALSGAMLMGSSEFISLAKCWQFRLGDDALLTTRWTDSKCQWDLAHASECFRHRFERLSKLVDVLREDPFIQETVRFTPETISSCTTHVYVRGSEKDLDIIHEETRAAIGVRIWDNLKGPGFGNRFALSDNDPWCYFEWTLGDLNMQLSDDVILDVWIEFGRRLHAFHR